MHTAVPGFDYVMHAHAILPANTYPREWTREILRARMIIRGHT